MPLTERDRRTLIIGGCTLAGIVALFLIYTLLTSGSGSEVALPPFSPPASTASGGPSSGPTGSQTGTPTVQPTVPPVQNFSGRDPFSMPADPPDGQRAHLDERDNATELGRPPLRRRRPPRRLPPRRAAVPAP